VRALLASPLGFLIGVSLGALGGGGSILAVPVLVYVAGQDAKQASATSLVVVGITSLIGMVPHLRAGRVRVTAGLVFGACGVGGSLLGSYWNTAVDADVLLLTFSGVMLVAAAAMHRRSRRAGRAPGVEPAPRPAGAAVATTPRVHVDPATAAKVAALGSVVGLMTGFFGVGGGFVIVPALVLALGFEMPYAVGTSLLVIAINSAVNVSTRLGSGNLVWSTVVEFTVAAVAGVFVGGRLADRVPARRLTRWFVVLLVAVAAYTAVRSANNLL